MRLATVFVALFLTISSALYASSRDSVYILEPVGKDQALNPDEVFSWRKLIIPSALFGVGLWGAENGWYRENVNFPIREWAGEIRGEAYFHADDCLQYLPVASYIALGFAAEGKHTQRERLVLLASSSLIMAATVNLFKYTVRSMRPDGSSRNSFPSGHTATAMMGAELVRLEYGAWYGAAAYAVATGVAALRVYNNRHWSNDLLSGAMAGIISANAAHWLLPLERKVPFLENFLITPALVPAEGEETGFGYGMALSLSF